MTETISFHAAGRVGVLKNPSHTCHHFNYFHVHRHALLFMQHRENCTVKRIIFMSLNIYPVKSLKKYTGLQEKFLIFLLKMSAYGDFVKRK